MSLISVLVFCTCETAFLIAQSGSFKPFPVKMHTILDFGLIISFNFISPATDAADAGSQNTPSSSAKS